MNTEAFVEYMQKSAQAPSPAATSVLKTLQDVKDPSLLSKIRQGLAGVGAGEFAASPWAKYNPLTAGLSLGIRGLGVKPATVGPGGAVTPYTAPDIKRYGKDVSKAFAGHIRGEGWGSKGLLGALGRAGGVEKGTQEILRNPALQKKLSIAQRAALQQGGTDLMRAKGKTIEAGKQAVGAWWDKNKGWLIPAGVGVGGLGLLATMLMSGRGQQQAVAPQRPININVGGAGGPANRWYQSPYWSGYNYRARGN